MAVHCCIGNPCWICTPAASPAQSIRAVSPPPDLHWQLLPQYEREMARATPNRLFGATVTTEGDAI